MLSSGVQQAPSLACGRGGTVYEKRPRPASTSNDIHAGPLHWEFVPIEQSYSLCRSGWLAIRSGGYADLALALSAVPSTLANFGSGQESPHCRKCCFTRQDAMVVCHICGRAAVSNTAKGTWMLKLIEVLYSGLNSCHSPTRRQSKPLYYHDRSLSRLELTAQPRPPGLEYCLQHSLDAASFLIIHSVPSKTHACCHTIISSNQEAASCMHFTGSADGTRSQ